jgi:type I restriction enzyme S subunit
MNAFPLVELGSLCRFVSGGTPRRNVERFFAGDMPWITGIDVTEDVITKARHYITKEAIHSSATNIVPAGNILLVTRTGVGKVAVAGVDICISQDFTGLLPDTSKVDTWFLFYYLRARQGYFAAHQRGATIQGVTREVVSQLGVPLPPLPEQKHIAAILAKADRLRELRRFARELSDGYLQSVFLEMFGDPVSNPRGWEMSALEKLLKSPPQNGLYVPAEQYESDDSQKGIEMVHMSDLFYEVVQRGNLKRVKDSVPGLDKYSLTHNDLLIARRSLNFEGAAKPCRIPKSEEPLVFESSMIRITPEQARVLTTYLYYYLANERAKKARILKYVTQSTISGINQDGLKRLEIIVPPLPLQQSFVHIVHKFERLRGQQREAERQGEHLFQTLLDRAFGGEL